ncbi:CD3324 family protein [Cytobacillus gottheilii]|uniref:CD3324 family protein n=1 Tax=Cytobacillus gottheilii TaxID=859144 RepID=UPI0009B936DA|nr:CD3324 family protein [Cytobacillus gottheilii]
MKYVKATAVLPEQLIMEIQKYIQGESIYIPKQEEAREKWGAKTGVRIYLKHRNEQICALFQSGKQISDLADEFCLAPETIKKIVYKKKR